MSKKLIRISDSLKVAQRLPEFLNKKINIVLNDSTVVFGELTKVSASEIILKNMRLKDSVIPVKNIHELYIDVDA